VNADTPEVRSVPAPDSFTLSRLYAKGWAAGADHASDQSDGELDALADTLNPGQTQAERARWRQGFAAAIERGRNRPARKMRPLHPQDPRSAG
jgi:hypothetical protein